MRMRFYSGLASLCGLLIWNAAAVAQPMARAVPFAESDDGIPTPPAVPFDTVTSDKEIPTPRAVPFEEAPVEVRPTPTPAPVPEQPVGVADEDLGDTEIRVTPGGSMTPEQGQMAVANRYYGRKQFEFAAAEYENYLRIFPTGQDRQAAFYRLGESYRLMGNVNNARNVYENLLLQFKDGPYVAPTAYRLGEMFFSVKDYRSALPLYETAGQKTDNPAVRLAAQYREAFCLDLLGRPETARVAYRKVLETQGENPYIDATLLSLAQIAGKTGREGEALEFYGRLAETAKKPAIRAEAAVKGGMLAVQLKENDRAEKMLRQALEYKDSGQWTPLARLGLLKLAFDSSRYEDVIKTFGTTVGAYPPDIQPQAMLLVGNAYQQLERYEDATRIYDELIEKYPESNEAKESQYRRLIPLYRTNNPQLHTRIAEFLVKNPTGKQADKARIIDAEAYYKEKNYAMAAQVYEALLSSDLEPESRAEILYKLGWCLDELNDPDKAVTVYGLFLKEFPNHSQVPAALAGRGWIYKKQNNLQSALEDFDRIINDFSDAPQREIALYNKAVILGQQKDDQGMQTAFFQLLKEFPKSRAAAEANYWIGKIEFDNKHYKECVSYFDKARILSPDTYTTKTALSIILAYYYTENPEAVSREVDAYLKLEHVPQLPNEVLYWQGQTYFEKNQFESAEKYLTKLLTRENLIEPPVDAWLLLGKSNAALGHVGETQKSIETYLEKTEKPAGKAQGYLVLAQAQLDAQMYDDSLKSVEQAMKMQPEGRLNAEARLLGAEIDLARGNAAEAAKAFLSVSLLFDDPELTPRALERAGEAYRQAGDTEESAKVMNQLRTKFPEYKISKPDSERSARK